MNSSDGEIGSDSDTEKSMKERKRKHTEDEEARLRRKLLEKTVAARAGHSGDKREKAEGKKKRRRHSPVLPPSKSPTKHAVEAFMAEEYGAEEGMEDSLTIRPPQHSDGSRKKHHKKGKDREDKGKASRHDIRGGGQHGADPELETRKKRRIEEGWERWKRSLGSSGTRDVKKEKDERRADAHRRGSARELPRSRRQPPPPPSSKYPPTTTARKVESSRSGRRSTSRTSMKPSESKRAELGSQEQAASKSNERGTEQKETVDRTPTQDEVEDQLAQRLGFATRVHPTAAVRSSPSSSESESSPGSSTSDSDSAGEISPEESKDKAKEEDATEGKVPVKYSKFESSEEEVGEESEGEIVDEKDSDSQTAPVDTPPPPPSPDRPPEQAQVKEPETEPPKKEESAVSKLPVYYPGIYGCRSVEEFHCLNKIEEGTYGVVYRAKEKRTDEIVALKRLKMEKEKEGFPITSLREINMLLKAGGHENIVNVREIVVGSNMDKIYLIMDYVHHDMKSLMESLKQPFLIGEVKTLMQQLLAGVQHLHDNWILHRDLKTSNLLLSHQGVLQIGDFGLAREYGSPLKPYTPIVVTLWYRAPELLLGVKEYSTAIDMWSVGCIMAEFLTLKPLFPGKGEMDQINRIFKTLGTPSETIWPGYSDLPGPKKLSFAQHPYNTLRKHFDATLSDKGYKLLNRFLTYNPAMRMTAEEALKHDWLNEQPKPVPREMFPSWPAKSELKKPPPRKTDPSPKPPPGANKKREDADGGLLAELNLKPSHAPKGFSLRFDAPKF